jgi:hypothetical protein
MSEVGAYDLPANIDKIKEVTGYEKILYLGHSVGTNQLLHGFTLRPAYFKESLLKVVGMTPCFVPLMSGGPLMQEEFIETYLKLENYGIYSFTGPNWEHDRQILFEEFYELSNMWLAYDTKSPTSVQTYIHRG